MEVYCLFMMRKKEKVITMTVTLILAVILICIKVTHFVIIERPLKQCRIVSAYHLTVDTNGAQIDQSWLFEKDDLTYIDIAKTFERTYFVTDYAGGSGDSGGLFSICALLLSTSKMKTVMEVIPMQIISLKTN